MKKIRSNKKLKEKYKMDTMDIWEKKKKINDIHSVSKKASADTNGWAEQRLKSKCKYYGIDVEKCYTVCM